MKMNQCPYFFDNVDAIEEIMSMNRVFLFLDYDGTLTPIVESPENAILSDDIRTLINQLKEKYNVAVISGRGIDNIKQLVGIEDMFYAGNHGSEIWNGRKVFVSQDFAEVSSKLIELLSKLSKKLSHIPGILIEDKRITASIHFRKVWIKHLGELFAIFWDETKGYEDTFRITSGKKVFEIRPLNAWNKGDAVNWIMDSYGNNMMPVYVGDDTTDEDAFRAISGHGLSICVGGSLKADFHIKSQEEVQKLLNYFLDRFS
jgi:trehalose-phosphatase